MTLFKVVLFIVSFCAIHVKCEKCELDDDECVTNATVKIYPDIVAGRSGVETSDPLTRYVINVDVPDISYNLHNAQLTGLKDCKVLFMKLNLTDQSLKYGIMVPNLVIQGDYRVDGQINGTSVSGKGKCKLTYTDYEIIFHDKYMKTIDKNDKRYHQLFNIGLDLDVKGKAKYEYEGLWFDGKSEVSEENLQKLNELIQEPIMHSFMQKHVDHVNDFLNIVSITEIITF